MKSVPRLRNIILPTPQAPLPFPVTTYPSPKGNHYSSLQYHGLIFELYENGIKPCVLFFLLSTVCKTHPHGYMQL